MGWGDELMVAGEARRIYQKCGCKVEVLSRLGGTLLTSPLWRRINYIAQPGEAAVSTIIDSPASRPYRQAFDDLGSIWREYTPFPAEIAFTDAELEFAKQFGSGFVAIEPHVKLGRDGAENKQWGWQRYAELVLLTPQVRWLQISEPGKEALPSVTLVKTRSFREACAVLARAAAYVGPEGGLHHASAAVGIPAVVIFGGYISPKVTGYVEHTNLFSGSALGCGRRAKYECTCMERIPPHVVAAALARILRGGVPKRCDSGRVAPSQ